MQVQILLAFWSGSNPACILLVSWGLEIFKILLGGKTEKFLTAAGFHCHEFLVLVTMHATDMVETFKIPLEIGSICCLKFY